MSLPSQRRWRSPWRLRREGAACGPKPKPWSKGIPLHKKLDRCPVGHGPRFGAWGPPFLVSNRGLDLQPSCLKPNLSWGFGQHGGGPEVVSKGIPPLKDALISEPEDSIPNRRGMRTTSDPSDVSITFLTWNLALEHVDRVPFSPRKREEANTQNCRGPIWREIEFSQASPPIP